jgi:hypothetical protein
VTILHCVDVFFNSCDFIMKDCCLIFTLRLDCHLLSATLRTTDFIVLLKSILGGINTPELLIVSLSNFYNSTWIYFEHVYEKDCFFVKTGSCAKLVNFDDKLIIDHSYCLSLESIHPSCFLFTLRVEIYCILLF